MKSFPSKYLLTGIISCAGISILDALLPLGIADGMLYVSLVLLGMMARNRNLIIIAAVIGSALNILGYFFSPPGGELTNVITNRVLAFFTICLAAILCLLKNNADEKLTAARNFLEARVQDRTTELRDSNKRLNNEVKSAKLVEAIAMAANETRAIDDTLTFCIERAVSYTHLTLPTIYSV